MTSNGRHRVEIDGCKVTITSLRTKPNKSMVIKFPSRGDVADFLDIIFNSDD